MVLILGCAAILVLIAVVAFLGRTEQPTAPELEGDWWPQFEREFRAYAERRARGAR